MVLIHKCSDQRTQLVQKKREPRLDRELLY